MLQHSNKLCESYACSGVTRGSAAASGVRSGEHGSCITVQSCSSCFGAKAIQDARKLFTTDAAIGAGHALKSYTCICHAAGTGSAATMTAGTRIELDCENSPYIGSRQRRIRSQSCCSKCIRNFRSSGCLAECA